MNQSSSEENIVITNITQVVDWLVATAELFTWLLFLPQIRLLIKVKDSKSISLGMTWGSWILQVLILTQSILHQTWTLAFTMGMSVFFLSITIVCIHYYRIHPGGKPA
ncbi:hypothetical protein KC902_02175 [Candidatus Kaiserbacteria bacterium]|nr:hypothetical protein [Candidatus Kaiserbacteria bacterium]